MNKPLTQEEREFGPYRNQTVSTLNYTTLDDGYHIDIHIYDLHPDQLEDICEFLESYTG